MESVGLIRCFERLTKLNNLRNKTYIGDGDSSSYASVMKADPYPGLLIQKGECIGHIQKRVGSRLGRLKTSIVLFWHCNKKQHRSFMGDEKGHWNSVLSCCCEADDIETRHQFCSRKTGYMVSILEMVS